MNLVDLLLPFHQKREVNMAANPDEPLKKAVVTFLAERDVVVEFPADWSWAWTLGPNPSGYSGNLPKRVSKLHYQQHKKRISVKVQSDLGEMFQRLVPEQDIYVVDFDNDFAWTNGDFGDKSSCFAQSRSKAAFKLLAGAGGFALRHWQGDKGVGRALLCPYQDSLAIFNAYYSGFDDRYRDGKNKLLLYTQLVARLTGSEYVHASGLYGCKPGMYQYSGTFYTNGSGYLLGQKDTIKKLAAESVYLGIPYS